VSTPTIIRQYAVALGAQRVVPVGDDLADLRGSRRARSGHRGGSRASPHRSGRLRPKAYQRGSSALEQGAELVDQALHAFAQHLLLLVAEDARVVLIGARLGEGTAGVREVRVQGRGEGRGDAEILALAGGIRDEIRTDVVDEGEAIVLTRRDAGGAGGPASLGPFGVVAFAEDRREPLARLAEEDFGGVVDRVLGGVGRLAGGLLVPVVQLGGSGRGEQWGQLGARCSVSRRWPPRRWRVLPDCRRRDRRGGRGEGSSFEAMVRRDVGDRDSSCPPKRAPVPK
jgi:hypothetical protein